MCSAENAEFTHRHVIPNPDDFFLAWNMKGDILKNVTAALFHVITIIKNWSFQISNN